MSSNKIKIVIPKSMTKSNEDEEREVEVENYLFDVLEVLVANGFKGVLGSQEGGLQAFLLEDGRLLTIFPKGHTESNDNGEEDDSNALSDPNYRWKMPLKFNYGENVRILPLNCPGRVVFIIITSQGIKYGVRYFDNSVPMTLDFFPDELELTKVSYVYSK